MDEALGAGRCGCVATTPSVVMRWHVWWACTAWYWGGAAGSLCPPVTSRRTCAGLAASQVNESYGTAGWGPPDALGLATVCGSSPQGAGVGCWGASTVTEAAAHCRHLDARLCTLDELLLNEAAGTGCGFDGKMVWSSTRGRCGPGHFFAVAGAANNAVEPPLGKESTLTVLSPTCVGAQEQLAVRCCGDTVVTPASAPQCKGRSGATCAELGWPAISATNATVCADAGSAHSCASDPTLCQRQLSRQ